MIIWEIFEGAIKDLQNDDVIMMAGHHTVRILYWRYQRTERRRPARFRHLAGTDDRTDRPYFDLSYLSCLRFAFLSWDDA